MLITRFLKQDSLEHESKVQDWDLSSRSSLHMSSLENSSLFDAFFGNPGESGDLVGNPVLAWQELQNNVHSSPETDDGLTGAEAGMVWPV